jgi:hypothetical protein
MSRDQTQGWLHFIVRNRKPTAYALFVLSALLTLGLLLVAWRLGRDYLVIAAALGWLALVLLAAGLYRLLREPEPGHELDAARTLVLAVGGLSGLIITFMGLVLAWLWWDTYLSWLRGEPGKEGWRMWLSVVAFFGGLAIMFAGLQLARTDERSNPVFRRLLYGYNAVLTALLLMAILAVVNVLVYVNFASAIDFTASNLYTLSSRSKNILQGLDKPTKIYVIMTLDNEALPDTQTLLSNCRDINEKIAVKYLSPDLDADQVRELERKYSFSGRQGMLVVYGSDPDENHRFVPNSDLMSMESFGARDIKYKGEDALMTALSALSEGKSKPVLYFTQGHGELDLNNSDPNQPDEGTGALRSRLEKRNYDIKPLSFSPAKPEVPDDAAIVVIIRPSIPYSAGTLDALRRYMKPADSSKKKGKLLICFDVVTTPEHTMARTGLEDFLKEFKVEVGNERILSLSENPTRVRVLFNPAIRNENPVAAMFRDMLIALYDARPVKPITTPPPAGAPAGSELRADSFLLAPAELGIWAENNLQADPSQIVSDLQRNEKDLVAKLSREPLSVAVAVSEPSPTTDPHAFMRPASGQTPRLVVFGDATLASNRFTSERRGDIYYEMIANTLDWLREKPSSIGIEPKTRNMFNLDTTNTNLSRMILLPATLMMLGIIGLGVGVWVVRRQ